MSCQVPQQIVCNEPYIQVGSECCLDQDGNQICDKDEKQVVAPTEEVKKEQVVIIKEENATTNELNETQVQETIKEVPKEKTLMQKLIEKAPKSYYFFNFKDNAGAIVVGDKRSDGYVEYEFAEFWWTLLWDVNTKRILINAPLQMSERWYNLKHNLPPPKENLGKVKYFPTYFELNLTGDPDKDVLIIPQEFKKYYWAPNMDKKTRSEKYRGKKLVLIFFDSFYTKGPVDMMKEYALEKPIKIDKKPRIIRFAGKQTTSNLSISFKKKGDPSKTVVFRFDPKLNVPLLIDELDDKGHLVTQTEFDVLVKVTYQGKRNTPILEKFVQPTPGYITITPKEYDEYKEAVEDGSWTEYFQYDYLKK